MGYKGKKYTPLRSRPTFRLRCSFIAVSTFQTYRLPRSDLDLDCEQRVGVALWSKLVDDVIADLLRPISPIGMTS